MSFEFNPYGAVVSVSWLMCLPRELFVPVLISFLAFCSTSTYFSVLLLLLLEIFAFIQASLGTRRILNGLIQKRFGVILLGGMLSLFGEAMGSRPEGKMVSLLGLFLMLPNGITSYFFVGFFEKLNLKSYLGSVVIPAFVVLDILSKTKTQSRALFPDVWEYGVPGLAAVSLIFSAVMVFLRQRFKSLLVFFSQTFLGLATLILCSESPSSLPLALTAIAIATVGGICLLNFASQVGFRSFAFARIACLIFPGTVGFSAFYFSTHLLFGINPYWVGLESICFLLVAAGLIQCRTRRVCVSNLKARVGFWLVSVVIFVAGAGLFWMGGEVIK